MVLQIWLTAVYKIPPHQCSIMNYTLCFKNTSKDDLIVKYGSPDEHINSNSLSVLDQTSPNGIRQLAKRNSGCYACSYVTPVQIHFPAELLSNQNECVKDDLMNKKWLSRSFTPTERDTGTGKGQWIFRISKCRIIVHYRRFPHVTTTIEQHILDNQTTYAHMRIVDIESATWSILPVDSFSLMTSNARDWPWVS